MDAQANRHSHTHQHCNPDLGLISSPPPDIILQGVIAISDICNQSPPLSYECYLPSANVSTVYNQIN